MKRRVMGYFTVEASLLLPIVFAFYLFLIGMMIFQYDRCLMEQDMETLILKYGYTDETNPEKQLFYMQAQAGKLTTERYIWMEPQDMRIRIKGWRLTVHGGGMFGGIHCENSFQTTHFNPAFLVRATAKAFERQESERQEKGVE